jgi:hypothetical protein
LETKLTIKGKVKSAVTDSGASSLFMDSQFAADMGIPLDELPTPIAVKTIDDSGLKRSDVTHCTALVEIETCLIREILCFFIIDTKSQPIVLGAPWLERNNPDIDWQRRQLTSRPPHRNIIHLHDHHPFSISLIGADEFLDDEPNAQIFSLYITPERSEKAPDRELPQEYGDFSDVFDKLILDVLPPHRQYDYAIDLKPCRQPPFGPLYPLSEPEAAALREFLAENLPKRFVTESTSPADTPVLFVSKKDESRRLCIDYRGLNAITI